MFIRRMEIKSHDNMKKKSSAIPIYYLAYSLQRLFFIFVVLKLWTLHSVVAYFMVNFIFFRYFDHWSVTFGSAHTKKKWKEKDKREGGWRQVSEKPLHGDDEDQRRRRGSVKELLNLKLTIMLIERCRYCDQPSGMEF